MLFLEFSITIFSLLCLFGISLQFKAYDETLYIDSFENLKKDSYSDDLPEELTNQCKDKEKFSLGVQPKSITNSLTSDQVQRICGTNTICTIEKGVTVTMISNLNVGALFVKGNLKWDDQTQKNDKQWLCAGYVVVIQ